MCLSVNNCCCCFTLDVGTKIISVVGTLSSLISSLLYGSSALLGTDLPASRVFFYSSMAVVACIQGIFGCFLIYGAFTHKPQYTVPWMVLTWSKSVTLLALAVTGTVLISYNRKAETTAEISTVISVYFLYSLILFYFASVVNSRRQQMLTEDRTEASKRLMRVRVMPNYYA